MEDMHAPANTAPANTAASQTKNTPGIATKLAWAISGIIILSGLCLIACCAGALFFLEIPFHLCLGWIWFIAETWPQVTFDWPSVALALVALTLFTWGTHRLGNAFLSGWNQQQSVRSDLSNQNVATDSESPVGVIEGQYPPTERDPISEKLVWKWRWTLSGVAIVLLMFAAGTAMIGATHQVVWLLTSDKRFLQSSWNARESSQSRNNLKQIGLALHNYHDVFTVFPPGGTFDRVGRGHHSWQTFLLPFTDQAPLYNTIDFDVPWNETRNQPQMQTGIPVYFNPGVPADRHARESDQFDSAGYGLSHYAANGRVLEGNGKLAIKQVTDGTSNTILAGEVNAQFKPWGDPTNMRDPALGINRSPAGFGGPWNPERGGAQFLLGDGSVRFLRNDIDPRILDALSTPNGGESLEDAEW